MTPESNGRVNAIGVGTSGATSRSRQRWSCSRLRSA